MQNAHFIVFVLGISFVIGMLSEHSTEAKIPPIPQEDLEGSADVIVVGEVLTAKKVGDIHHDHCYGWQPYEVRLKVETLQKGDVGTVVIVHYEERVVDKEGCVGGEDSYHLSENARYKLYVQAIDAVERTKIYGFFHWMCVESLPSVSELEQAKSNPYVLADLALAVYRARDLRGYGTLLAEPLREDDTIDTVFRAALLHEDDEVKGLYFLKDEKDIAAVVRTTDDGEQAVYFHIIRTDTGFAVKGLEVSDSNPPMENPVEGIPE